jgi:hypothetical protein
MDERARRIGLNEALFRQINDRLEHLNHSFAPITGTVEIVCECGDRTCIERIILPLDQYETARADPTQYVVAPGHDDPSDIERVASRGDGYAIINKQGNEPERLAEATNPRN